MLSQLRALTPDQRNAFLAAYLGWALDAFDYFILIFVISDVAKTFHVPKQTINYAVTLTLMFRPVGAFVFGLLADRFGRRLPLLADVILYSALEVLSGFAPSATAFLVLRALFGIAMGGEWGLGASLAMETIPIESRGFLSGVLQQGYPVGYLLAAVAFYFVFPALGWRWMFFLGALPALLSLFIRARVKESPVWERGRVTRTKVHLGRAVADNLGLFLSMVLLMTAFNFMSHGTQDAYPSLFLRDQRHFSAHTTGLIAAVYNVGAICGGILFGSLSQWIGRRRAIITAALLAIPLIPLWVFAPSAALLAVGAFGMQFFVQGAWGVIPAHLSELAPNVLRGTFTGFAYQVGNLIASVNLPLQQTIAKHHGGNYAYSQAVVILVVLLAVAVITALGREAKGVAFEEAPA